MNIDYALCVDLLGLNENQFALSQSIPPHTIIRWSGPDPQPTEAECKAVWETYIAAEPIRLLREKRNNLLAETDWMAFKDVTLPAAWKTYRQALRDLTTGLDTVEKVNAVTWPTKPS